MASLFQGTPQTATSYTTSSTETPKWMQDAIYNQIQLATGVANTPYQAYSLPRVAELSPLQQQAYRQVQANQGLYEPAMSAATTGVQELSNSPAGMAAAQPYMTAAARSAAETVGSYMNPYTDAVTNRIAQLGARNLSENLLPAVSDQFIRAGQFGSGRMGEFGARALRDTQESVLGQQAQALQQGYGQALGAAQTDLARQGQLGSTAGSLAGADVSRQLGALQQLANLQLQGQQLRTADVAALESAGTAQQRQAQAQLDAAAQQYQEELLYPKQQLDWLNTQIRGMAPITPTTTTASGTTTGATYSPSPLSQLAAGLYTYKGLTS